MIKPGLTTLRRRPVSGAIRPDRFSRVSLETGILYCQFQFFNRLARPCFFFMLDHKGFSLKIQLSLSSSGGLKMCLTETGVSLPPAIDRTPGGFRHRTGHRVFLFSFKHAQVRAQAVQLIK